MALVVGVESIPVLEPIFAISGAACASGSLALARKAAAPSLPPYHADSDAAPVRRPRDGRGRLE